VFYLNIFGLIKEVGNTQQLLTIAFDPDHGVARCVTRGRDNRDASDDFLDVLFEGLSRRRRAITESAEVAGIRRPHQPHRAIPKTPRLERAGAFGPR
jgi:hypothetical protein